MKSKYNKVSVFSISDFHDNTLNAIVSTFRDWFWRIWIRRHGL